MNKEILDLEKEVDGLTAKFKKMPRTVKNFTLPKTKDALEQERIAALQKNKADLMTKIDQYKPKEKGKVKKL